MSSQTVTVHIILPAVILSHHPEEREIQIQNLIHPIQCNRNQNTSMEVTREQAPSWPRGQNTSMEQLREPVPEIPHSRSQNTHMAACSVQAHATSSHRGQNMTMAPPTSEQAHGCRHSRDPNMNMVQPTRGQAPGCHHNRDQNMNIAPPIREQAPEHPTGQSISIRVILLEEIPLGIKDQNIFMVLIMAQMK